MFAFTNASTVIGPAAVPVVVEASATSGLPFLRIVGVRASDAQAMRERVECGLRAAGVDLRTRRIVVSLAPADLPMSGAALDLPVALAILGALGSVAPDRLRRIGSHGELGLDGSIRATRGAVAAGGVAFQEGWEQLLVCRDSAEVAAHAPCPVIPVSTLAEAIGHLASGRVINPVTAPPMRPMGGAGPDLADVRGQRDAVESAVIAAAGGHNLLLFGVPGSGKTLLATRFAGMLPRMGPREALEVATIHDAAGLHVHGIEQRRPFRAPHHTISTQALVGGGSHRPIVGEVSLAHRGVLFLDELPEFRPSAIDALREPLQEREIRIRRAGWRVCLPCRSHVVAAMNLCRCGRAGSDRGDPCSCTEQARDAYRQRISGAILDRLDVRVSMTNPSGSLVRTPSTMTTNEAARQVADAWDQQAERWGPGTLNAHVAGDGGDRFALSNGAREVMDEAVRQLGCSGRTQRSVIAVARTIADIDGSVDVDEDHALRAFDMCRSFDRDSGT